MCKFQRLYFQKMSVKGVIDDLAALPELSSRILLDEIEARYHKGIIYASTDYFLTFADLVSSVEFSYLHLKCRLYNQIPLKDLLNTGTWAATHCIIQ